MFDNQLAKKFLTHMSPSLVEGDYENVTKSDDLSMGRIIEQYPLRGNLLTHLDENGVNSWDYVDKKCKYHRRDSGQGWDIAEKIFKKHVGKTYKEIKEIILKKRCRHFFEMSLLDQLKIAYTGTHDIYNFNSVNKLELKEKIITTKNEYNPYLYRKLDLS